MVHIQDLLLPYCQIYYLAMGSDRIFFPLTTILDNAFLSNKHGPEHFIL